ncbi:MAG: PAAR domain-containing protein [Pseudomonadota bacterium]
MPKAFRLGDIAEGHDLCPPTPAIEGSPTVFVEGKPVVRLGDQCAPHGSKDHPVHPRSMSAGSGTVFVDGKPATRVGDAVSCGGDAAAGSGTVSFGD